MGQFDATSVCMFSAYERQSLRTPCRNYAPDSNRRTMLIRAYMRAKKSHSEHEITATQRFSLQLTVSNVGR